MQQTPPDEPSEPLDRAMNGYAWATQATSIALSMVMPIVLGAILDRYLPTKPWGSMLGAAAGLTWGIWRLARLKPPKRRP
jgi:F0F1-type ATP synthase assembly protein I